MSEEVYYTAKGVVFGKYWGSGSGYYPTGMYSGRTFTEIKEKVNKDFERGALDSGMGYEYLLGALMDITKHTTITKKGIAFTNRTMMRMWLGKINKKEAKEVLKGYE